MQIALFLGYFFLGLILIHRCQFFHIQPYGAKPLQIVFTLKVIAGTSLAFIYTYYYTDRTTADIFKYFDDSEIIFNSLFQKPYDFIRMFTGIGSQSEDLQPYYETMSSWNNSDSVYNDNRNLIRLNTFFRFFSLGSYHVHTLFMCFIALTGLMALYKSFTEMVNGKQAELFVAVFLLPSVIFWTSGVLKDGLLIFCFGILFYNIYLFLNQRKNTKTILIIILVSAWLTILKLYILVITLPGFFLFFVFKYKPSLIRFSFLTYCITYLIYFLCLFNIYWIIPDFDFAHMIYRKQFNFLNLITIMPAGSVIDIPILDGSVYSIIINSPTAFLNILLRPYLWEVSSIMMLPAALENILIFLCIIVCVTNRNKNELINKPLFYFSLFFVIILFTLTGLVTPVMGAFVRYKVAALPFLFVLLIMLYDRQKVISRFRRRK